MLSILYAPRLKRAARRLVYAGMAFAVCICLSCVTTSDPEDLWKRAEKPLVWPPPPEQAHIEFVGVLKAGKFGDRNGILAFLAGRERMAMIKPTAVATNSQGMAAVADTGVPTVHFFDLNSGKYRPLKQKYAAGLRSPVAVIVDPEGRFFVSDSVAGSIFVFTADGKLSHEFGGEALQRPTGLALDPSRGRLYVVDTVASQVVVFDLNGQEITRFGQRGGKPGEFNYPTYAAVTPEGNLCVTDSLNFRVQVFRPDGSVIRTIGSVGTGAGAFARPKGIAVDTAGHIYVVDAAFENVQIFSPEGTLLLAFGTSGANLAEFSLPCGLFIDSTDTIWVADSFNQRIQVFRLLETTK